MMAVDSLETLLKDLRRLLHETPEEGGVEDSPDENAPRVPPQPASGD